MINVDINLIVLAGLMGIGPISTKAKARGGTAAWMKQMKHGEEGPPGRHLKKETKTRSIHKPGQRLVPEPGGTDTRAAVEARHGWCTVSPDHLTQARSHANGEAPRSAPTKGRISKGSKGFYTAALALF